MIRSPNYTEIKAPSLLKEIPYRGICGRKEFGLEHEECKRTCQCVSLGLERGNDG
jgi:hypothetical protein